MESKRKPSPQPDLLAALAEAGYQQTRIKKLSGGVTTEIHLKPARLKGDDGNHLALEVCAAMDLQAHCRVFSAVPQDILILRVELPADEQPQASNPKPQTAE